MSTKLKPYMGFDRNYGSENGACLIFAHSIKEAKPLAFGIVSMWCGIDYIDTGCNLIKGVAVFQYADQEKLKNNIPHVIESPPVCKFCNLWSGDGLNENELCPDCAASEDY